MALSRAPRIAEASRASPIARSAESWASATMGGVSLLEAMTPLATSSPFLKPTYLLGTPRPSALGRKAIQE